MCSERILSFNADATEFCPTPGCEDVLAVGTYQLDEGTQTREGRLYMFRVSGHAFEDDLALEELSATDLAGILDMAWVSSEVQGGGLLAVGLADGFISLFKGDDLDQWKRVINVSNMEFNEEEIVLSVDTAACSSSTDVYASGSSGNLAVFNVRYPFPRRGFVQALCSFLNRAAWMLVSHKLSGNQYHSPAADAVDL